MTKNQKTISVDFDGVIIRLFLGRLWRRQPLHLRSRRSSYLFVDQMEYLWNYFWQPTRGPIPGSLAGLTYLKKHTSNLCLLTSRTGNLFPLVVAWLQQHGYKGIFNQKFCNREFIPSHLFKKNMIIKNHISLHVDDDPVTLEFLAKELPQVNFIHLRYYHQPLVNLPNVHPYNSWSEFITNYFSKS